MTVRSKFGVVLPALLVAAALSVAPPAQAKTQLACDGTYKVSEDGYPVWDWPSVNWATCPKDCFLSTDSTTAGQVNLQNLTWSNWGKRKAVATGDQVGNHFLDDGTLPRYSTTVTLSGRVRACKRKRPNRWFYTTITVNTPEIGENTYPFWFLPRWQCRPHRGE